MPIDVEATQQQSASAKASAKAPPKLGARAVVELLKHNQPEKIPAEFMMIDARKRDALESLLQLLTRFQLQIAKSPYANASVLSLITKYLIENSQCLFISKPDLGAIYLVDQIFDKLLNSDKFDREAWCLIAQTRFPITKFALQDFSFFFAPQNIGRRLLNSITLNLLGSASSQKDQVRKAVEQFVGQLNQQYRSNVSEFNSVCIETQAWFASQQRHLSKIETKVSQVGQAGGDRAEPCIIEFLNKTVAGQELPSLLVDFIYGEWRNSLRLVMRQDGEKSANWKRQMSLTQSMVQFYDACKTEDGRIQYTRFLPSMLKGIKGLLVSVSDKPEALEAAFDPLELILNALVRGAEPDLTTAPTLENKSVVNETFEVVPVDEKYLTLVDEVQVGEWIRIRTKGNQYEACRLAVKGKDAEPWVLVNNTGSKIAKKNRYALAQGLRDGVVELVGKGQWIDDLLRVEFSQLIVKLEKHNAAAAPVLKPELSVDTIVIDNIPLPTVEEIEEPQIEIEHPQADQEVSKVTTETKNASVVEDISLVSMDEQNKSYHGGQADHQERTDEILSGSALSIVGAEVATNSTDLEDVKEESWEEYYQEEKELSPKELEAATKAVQLLEVGALINRSHSGKDQRCKLAVKMIVKDKFIFVNHLGVKVWDTNTNEVVEAIARGEVTVVDNGVKFDRALEQVVMNIQADKRVQG